LTLALTLHWQGSVPASAFHSAEAVLRGQALADAALGQTLSAPAQKLREALDEEAVPFDTFWLHLIPLSAAGLSGQELARVTLVKTIGLAEAKSRVPVFRELLADLLHAFSTALSKLQEELDARIEPKRQSWNYQGTSLLAGIVNWTEELILVEEARVVLVYPALGRGGVAHLPYNLVRIEAVASDPIAELPEVVQLGWLISTLNLDLPRYSENVRPKLLAKVAALAMLPITLKAANDLTLTKCDEETTRLALRHWLPAVENAERLAPCLSEWWDTYCAMRPEFPTALAALDRLIGSPPEGADQTKS
jgi:hypothetical protein